MIGALRAWRQHHPYNRPARPSRRSLWTALPSSRRALHLGYGKGIAMSFGTAVALRACIVSRSLRGHYQGLRIRPAERRHGLWVPHWSIGLGYVGWSVLRPDLPTSKPQSDTPMEYGESGLLPELPRTGGPCPRQGDPLPVPDPAQSWGVLGGLRPLA